MVKRIACVLLMLGCLFAVQAQQPMPLNPKVRHGVLPNGLNYYLLHNEEPKGIANFYIAQKVGSTLETPQQLGLAHFLEHMAFNGSKNFPGNKMLDYLQKNGIRFGSDINAYTGFDETVYRIENIPVSNAALMDSTLLILHDWSCDLELADEEIDNERGVIEEEWRSRNDADTRMYTNILPKLYKEYQYAQMPIGSMDIVKNFPYKDLRDYYEKWYRPDQQGIIIVGDFDVDEMETKVKNLFTPIEMPENAAERTYATVSDNEQPIYISFEDPEMQRNMIMLSFKYDKIPFEYRNTDLYFFDEVCKNLISVMINNRLADMSQKPSCAFAYAGVSFGDYYISTTKGAFNVMAIAKDNINKAFEEALAEVVRACKTGFTDSELERAKDELKAGVERLYNERDKTKSATLANDLVRHFIDNTPEPGIEAEWNFIQQIFPMISAAKLNQAVGAVISPNNQVLLVCQPQVEGKPLPTEAEMLGTLNEVMNREYQAYQDEVISEPLIAKLPKKGKIKSTRDIESLGIKEFTLSNGAHVYIKPTDFAADDIRFIAFTPHGKAAFNGDKAAELNAITLAVEASKLGNFDNNRLRKVLTGKNLSTSYFVNNYSSGFTGYSNVKDFETLMQLLYLQFTDVRPDAEAYEAKVSQIIPVLTYQEKDPQTIFMRKVYDAWYAGNPYSSSITVDQLNSVDYPTMLDMSKSLTENAANFDFIFVGNIDEKTFIPLMERYIASLPANKKKANKTIDAFRLNQAKGLNSEVFDLPMESPQVKVFDIFNGNNVPMTLENEIKTNLIGDILRIVYTRTLREEEGGTYSPSAQSVMNPTTGEWTVLYTFTTGDDGKDRLTKRAYDEFINLLNNGASEEDFNKVKGAALAQFKINSKKNSFWANSIFGYLQNKYDAVSDYESILENLTLAEFNDFMKNLYDGENRVEVIMNGVQAAK